MYKVREDPLICALLEIRTTFKFRWVGGLEIRGFSNWIMKKNACPKNKYFIAEIQQNPFRNQKGILFAFLGKYLFIS